MNDNEKLKELLKMTVKELKENGVTVSEIVEMVKTVGKTGVSRLVVTKDLRLLLIDYQVEIKLEPLHKAIYLLFLNHPEGIRYKELPDYREELAAIYHSMKRNTQARKKIERSIEDVTNPIGHSIIEKCTRINSIIKNTITSSIVSEYLITGKIGEPRRIRIDRSLVRWEEHEA